MKMLMFEGTTQEFDAVAHLFRGANHGEILDAHAASEPEIDPASAVRRMLKRRPVSEGQRDVYSALADGPVEYNEFLKVTHRKSSEMAGVMGALGRRISNTKEIRSAGLPANSGAIFTWEQDGDKQYISLKDYAIEALREEGII
jgi:hypothetical protein